MPYTSGGEKCLQYSKSYNARLTLTYSYQQRHIRRTEENHETNLFLRHMQRCSNEKYPDYTAAEL
jgi:hypothetical protein